jgi:hypothetical protein
MSELSKPEALDCAVVTVKPGSASEELFDEVAECLDKGRTPGSRLARFNRSSVGMARDEFRAPYPPVDTILQFGKAFWNFLIPSLVTCVLYTKSKVSFVNRAASSLSPSSVTLVPPNSSWVS